MKNNEDSAQSPQELLRHLQSIVTEVEALASDTLGQPTAEALAQLRARFADARESIAAFYDDAKQKVVAGAQCTDASIRQNPYQSMAIALGVGLLLGVFVSRRRD